MNVSHPCILFLVIIKNTPDLRHDYIKEIMKKILHI